MDEGLIGGKRTLTQLAEMSRLSPQTPTATDLRRLFGTTEEQRVPLLPLSLQMTAMVCPSPARPSGSNRPSLGLSLDVSLTPAISGGMKMAYHAHDTFITLSFNLSK